MQPHWNKQGKNLIAGTLEAATLRLRPILMTSLAFMLGVVPQATGAGAAAQNSIGICVLGGMFFSTFIGVFMVPSFYVIVRSLVARLRGRKTSSRVRSTLRYPENCAKNKELTANPTQCADTPHIRYKLSP